MKKVLIVNEYFAKCMFYRILHKEKMTGEKTH